MRKEFVAAGFGGQGIILMGIIACTAAGLYDSKQVAQTQSYGPASRGGACRTDVIISDEEIDYAKALAPDVMVLMSPQAVQRYLGEAKAGSIVIIDSTLIAELPPSDTQIYRVPATRIAEAMGQRMVANMVMLGAVASITGLISREALLKAIRQTVQEKHMESNLAALEEGYRYGLQLRGETR